MILPNLHPFFVHFTVGLLAASVGFYVVARYWSADDKRTKFETAARYMLYAGVGLSFATVAAGFYAYFTVDHDDPSHLVMKTHRNLALATLLLFTAIAWVIKKREIKTPSSSVLATMVLALGFLGATGWYGGELVYRHGIGVMSLPAVSGEGHDHGEGGGHDEGGGHYEAAPTTSMVMNPSETADALHDALVAGDGDGVAAVLAEDVIILEGDHAQTNRDDYMSGHMLSDMAFLPNVSREILDRSVNQSGDLAWIITQSRTTGQYKDREIDSEARETLVMKHNGEKWEITLIHWDNS